MFIFGILSLFQIGLLPGLITLRLFRFRGTFWQGVVYTFALSLFVNYCAVFLLVTLNIYSRPLVLALFAVQLIWVVWLYREDLRKSLLDVFQNLWNRSLAALAGLFPAPEADLSQSQKTTHYVFLLFTLTALVFALDRMWWAWGVFLDNIGTVFDGWDTVYSWNRWAQVWFGSAIPLDSRFYPQLVPVNWSLTYIFMGESTIQLFAKSIMPLFVVGILLQLFDLGITLRQPGFFVAIILLRALIVRFIGSGIHNGYVDTAAAFFALLPFYTIIKAQTLKTESEQRTLWILGFLFAAATAVTKQTGVYIFPLYPLLLYVLLLRPTYGNMLNPVIWRSVLTWGGFAVLIPLSWYGFKLLLVSKGVDVSEVLDNAGYAAQAYGNVGFVSQVVQALQKFGIYLVLFPLILCALPLLSSVARWLFLLIILPFPIVWAVLASYDTRNLAIFLPFFALAGGLAAEAFVRLFLRLLTRIKLEKWTFALIPTALIVFLLVQAGSYPESRIRADDMSARQELFSPSLNKELRRLFADNPDSLILTNYPVEYVLGSENAQVSFWYTDVQEFNRLMKNDEITHLLVPTAGVNAEITSQIDQWVTEGYLTFVLQDQGSSVIPYRLYIIRR